MSAPVLHVTTPVGPVDAPLVILGPSLGTSTILWEDVVPPLATRYRVIAWDLPGHGASPAARAPFSVDDLADAVASVIPEFGEPPVLYAGVSLGGAVGLALALRHPQLVRAAAIIASGARLGDPESWADRAAAVRATSTSSIIVPSAQRWFAPESMARIPELSGRLLHALQDADDESYALACEALAAYDVRPALPSVRTPVLAMWGEHDGVAPLAKAQEIADGVVDGAVEMIPATAHLPPAEQPHTVADALLAFFAAVERTTP